MINLFSNITSSDQSIIYLGQIFGNMSGVIPTGAELTVVGSMFRAFNSVVLAIGALIIIYATVVGVMQTAHEGEFMGKKWNNLWVPIRTVLGIATLIPTVSGFSAIQIIMMWVILQGVGAANFLWTTALGAINTLGSPYAQSEATINVPTDGLKTALQSLFKSLACDATAQIAAKDPTNTTGGGYYCQVTGNYCSANYSASASTDTLAIGPNNGDCGKVKYCSQATACADPSSTGCAACNAQIQAINQAIQTFSGIAAQFAQTDLAYREFYAYSRDTSYQKPGWITDFCSQKGIDPCCIPSSDPATFGGDCKGKPESFPGVNAGDPKSADPTNASSDAVDMYKTYALKSYFPTTTTTGTTPQKDFIDIVADQYISLMKSAVASSISTSGASTLSGSLQEANQKGWLLAGSFYYAIAQVNNNTQQSTLPTLDISATVSQSKMKDYRNNFNAAGKLIGAASGDASDVAEGAGAIQSQGLDSVAGAFSLSGAAPTGTINPLAQLQMAGYTMLMIAQFMYLAFFAVTFAVGIAGNINFWVLGTGTLNPIGPGALLMYFVIVPLFYALLGVLVTLGGLFAIYVPLIPFTVFAFGVIGWLIAVIETMVAGPLVALSMLSPSGQGEILGNAQQALMYLFNVFLRPSLMIFGLILAMVLASVVVQMINYAFWGPVFLGVFAYGRTGVTADSARAAAVFNPIAFILFIMAYVATVVSALNKCFALIHILPQQVMQWVGAGHHMPGGAETGAEALGEAKGAVTKGAGAAAGGMAEGGQKVGGFATKSAQQKAGVTEDQMQSYAASQMKKGSGSKKKK